MKKSALKRRITEIEKYLTSPTAKEALEILRNEVEHYSEPVMSPKKMEIPKNIQNDELAYALYTDGACRGNPGPGSFAFLVQKPNGDILKEFADFEDNTTNNKMELKAIIKGIEFLSKQLTSNHTVHIFTDSKYAVDGMKSWISGWKKRGWKKADNKAPENLDLWKNLDQLSQNYNLVFNWVKGHAGHAQNEHVDQLANDVLDENGY